MMQKLGKQMPGGLEGDMKETSKKFEDSVAEQVRAYEDRIKENQQILMQTEEKVIETISAAKEQVKAKKAKKPVQPEQPKPVPAPFKPVNKPPFNQEAERLMTENGLGDKVKRIQEFFPKVRQRSG